MGLAAATKAVGAILLRGLIADRPHSQHHNESRLIMPSGHPGNYTSLTDVTAKRAKILRGRAGPCSAEHATVIVLSSAKFQAADMIAIMQGTTSDHRGVTSALVGLSRNMGLVCGASAMAALYSAGPCLAEAIGFSAASGAGLAVAFSGATCLAGISLGATLWGRK